MKIFITGGTGFIGKHLVNQLQEEELFILTRNPKPSKPSFKQVQFIQGDLEDIDKWKNKVRNCKPDATIHLAWEGIPDYGVKNSIKNLNQGLNLYKFLAEIKCKTILTTGSCWEYGQQVGKLSENTVPRSYNAFAAAKNSLHIQGESIAQDNNINFIWTRLFYVYGPGQKKESLIPYVMNNLKAHNTPQIKNLQTQNDFIYVDDTAKAIALLIKNNAKKGIYNIGSGSLTSVQTIIKLIYKNFKQSNPLEKNLPSSIQTPINFYADISKINQEVDWKPTTNIEEGIRKTIDYFAAN